MNARRSATRQLAGDRGDTRVRIAAALAALVVAIAIGASFMHDAADDPASPITVTKTANPSPATSGQQITYTITSVNTGGARLDNVTMTDQLNGVGTIQNPPATPQFIITSTKRTCSQSAQLVICNAGTLAGGESWVVTMRGVVTAPSGATLNNTASVTGTKAAQNFTTTASVQTLVTGSSGPPAPDLTINKTGPSSVAGSSQFNYTLTVNNVGTANATGVKVVDTLPPTASVISINATSLFSCTPTLFPAPGPVTVVCTGGAVNQGQNATITIRVLAPPAPDSLTNTAVVDPDNTISETNELNNTSAIINTSVTATPNPPLLGIVKTDDPAVIAGAGPDPVNPGQLITYKIRVTNNATTRADDVVIVDGTQGLDASSITATFVVVNGAVGTGGGCIVVAPQARCLARSLNAGGTITMTVKGRVIAPAGSSLINTATVTGNIKNTGVANSDSEQTTVLPAIDLTITKQDSPDPVCVRSWPDTILNGHLPKKPDNLAPAAGGTVPPILAAPVCLGGLTYTFVVGNSGNLPASGVTVRDPLPAGLIFDSYEDTDSAGFACSVDVGNVVTCTSGSIPAGPSATKRLKFLLVAPPSSGTISNTVYVDPNNTIFEADETNNTFTQTTQVTTGIDLVAWKSDSNPSDPPGNGAASLVPNTLADGFDPIATRGTETYTIVIDNVGTQDTTGIRVRDTLPADTIFLSVIANDPAHPLDPTHGFTCSHDGSPTGGIVECVGGRLLGTESEFYDPAGPAPVGPGDDYAIIKIKVFARSTVGSMHNEVRVDPLNEIPEVNEQNNIATDDTAVQTGDANKGSYNQLRITKTQVDPSPSAIPPDPDFTVAANGTVIYNLKVENTGTDPASAIVVKDFLPTGSRFIEAQDTDTGANIADAFLCVHDGAPYGGVITCTGGALSGTVNTIPDSPSVSPVPTSRDIKVRMFAPNTPGTYPNLAKVDPDNLIPEGNEFDNASQISTTVTIGGNNMFNELNLTKTQTSPTALCGGVKCVATSSVVEYTLVVKNDGSDPAFQVKVRDTLPAGFQFISADDAVAGANAFQCTNAANVIDCMSAMIAGSGATRTIVVRAFSAAQPGDYTNQAVVDQANTIPEGNETNNTAQETTRVRVGSGFIDLKVKKCDVPLTATCNTTDAPTQVDVLGTVTYYVEARNDGTDPAFNVTISDNLPVGVTFVSALDVTGGDGAFTCGYASGLVTCSGGTLDGTSPPDLIPGVPNVRNLQITVKAPNANGPITDQIAIDPAHVIPESNETNNSSTETTSILSFVNLTLDKTGPDTAQQNNTEDYTITIKNMATGGTPGRAVDNVHVLDTLPVGLIPLGWSAEGNFVCQIFENPVNTVDCVGDMNPGDEFKITVHVFITQDGGSLDNEACIDPDNVFVESNESDNCKTKTTQIKKFSPNLSVQKSADKSTVAVGETLTYTVTLSNIGDAGAKNPVTLTDALDTSSVTFADANATNGFTCTFASPNVTCNDPGNGLQVGASTTVTIHVTVNSGVTTPITNSASVPTAGFDATTTPCLADPSKCEDETSPNQANNSNSVTTNVSGSALNLRVLDLVDTPDPTAPGGIVTYTANVSNLGTATASGVVVRTELTPDAGLTATHVNSAGSNGFICTFTSFVDCTGSLPAGVTTTLTMQFQFSGTIPPDKTVSVKTTADPSGVITESDETDNEKTTVTTVHANCSSGCIDLVMGDITDSPDPVAKDGYVTYTIGVGNAGDTQSGAFKIKLTVTDAADIDFAPGGFDASQPSADYSATSGFDCSLTAANEVTCDDSAGANDGLAPGEGVLITLKVHVLTTATHAFITLKAEADPGNADVPGEFSESNNDATESTGVVP